ncbi:uncharacterized protein LOC128395201 isoform X2 [Panonychus citri]|uniref:uncharacterized protein LOC128395201 isoform X2 n=1 Tax=Panonychus citri TaxID=50023 RepID=UPI002307BEBC|nr:uncharacterized protein LOC128395201 isoform X2 [Panonychus citri]
MAEKLTNDLENLNVNNDDCVTLEETMIEEIVDCDQPSTSKLLGCRGHKHHHKINITINMDMDTLMVTIMDMVMIIITIMVIMDGTMK